MIEIRDWRYLGSSEIEDVEGEGAVWQGEFNVNDIFQISVYNDKFCFRPFRPATRL
jgi:hypothetical protein